MPRTFARPIATLALAAAFALGGAWMLTREGSPEAGLPLLPGAALAQDATAPADPAVDPAAIVIPDMTIGAEDAPIEVIEYASFTCPHCAAFHADQYQRLKADWIDTGKVRFTLREVYFDRFGLWASMIARCAGPMRYFGIADLLYDQQREWTGDGSPETVAANLRTMGKTAGLSDAALDACLKDEDQAKALVAWYTANAARDGIESTPTFLIDGETYSNLPWDEFEAVLKAKLAD